MKKLIIGSAALLAIGLGGPAALAADMPLKAPPPPVPVYTWTGCYLGLSVGTSWGRSRLDTVAESRFTSEGIPAEGLPGPQQGTLAGPFDLSGFLGGAQAGCNYQFAGGWVIGVEVDQSVTNKEGQAFEDRFITTEETDFVASTKERWLGTARLRLGFTVWDKWLLYVTGGAAWAKFDTTAWEIVDPINTTITQSDWRVGWTVGVGTEYALGYGWSIKSELLYVDFSEWTTLNNSATNTRCCIIAPLANRVQDWVFRAGMNYKFGWEPAVVARY